VTGPRIEMLDEAAAVAAGQEAGIPDALSRLNIFRVLLRRPPAAKAMADLILGLMFRSRLDPRLRELVIMRLGWSTGSSYEWTQHWPIAVDAGITPEDVLGVRDWQAHGGFGPADRAVLAATDELVATGTLGDATWAACADAVPDEDALLELVLAIGNWRMVSGVLRTLQVPLEDGVAPWPPDGAAPGGQTIR
jgi:alkylhydroperoxidase family enzyme